MSSQSSENIRELIDSVVPASCSIRTLDGLVNRYSAFVREIETGYPLSIYDYINDLPIRGYLERLSQLLPSPSRERHGETLTQLDGRFMASTRESARPLIDDAADSPFWVRRIPSRAGEELLADLKSEGFV